MSNERADNVIHDVEFIHPKTDKDSEPIGVIVDRTTYRRADLPPVGLQPAWTILRPWDKWRGGIFESKKKAEASASYMNELDGADSWIVQMIFIPEVTEMDEDEPAL